VRQRVSARAVTSLDTRISGEKKERDKEEKCLPISGELLEVDGANVDCSIRQHSLRAE
jgi:hypothetical protein